jgi:hypothetical protein
MSAVDVPLSILVLDDDDGLELPIEFQGLDQIAQFALRELVLEAMAVLILVLCRVQQLLERDGE